ncbi:MAG: DUF2125 domain-containing protein [Parvibaculaceae bacterium]
MTDIPPVQTSPEPQASVPVPRRRTPLRIFLPYAGIALVFAVYSVYWVIAAQKLRAGIERASAQENSAAIDTDWSALTLGGYPYRISLTFTKPLADAPEAPEKWSWTADSLEADFLPYNLRHVVLKVDGEQRLTYSDVRAEKLRHLVRATSEGTFVSYIDEPNVDFGRLAIDINKPVIIRDGQQSGDLATDISGERLTADRLQLHMRPAADDEERNTPVNVPDNKDSYDIALQGDNMVLASSGPAAVLGSQVALIAVQARLRDVPHRNHASLVELSRGWLQQGGRLTVSDLRISWGPLELYAQGEMTLDEEARPKGEFNAEFSNYPKLLDALVAHGIIRREDARLATAGLSVIAQLQGKQDGRVSMPVIMRGGKLYLGPLPVATLEPLY